MRTTEKLECVQRALCNIDINTDSVTHPLTHSLTHSIVHSPSWQANIPAAGQEILYISWNSVVHYLVPCSQYPIITISHNKPIPQSPYPTITLSHSRHVPQSPRPPITMSRNHHIPQSTYTTITLSRNHHIPQSPYPTNCSIPSHFNLVYTPSYSFKNHFTIALSCTPTSSRWVLYFIFPTKTLYDLHTFHMRCPSHPP